MALLASCKCNWHAACLDCCANASNCVPDKLDWFVSPQGLVMGRKTRCTKSKSILKKVVEQVSRVCGVGDVFEEAPTKQRNM